MKRKYLKIILFIVLLIGTTLVRADGFDDPVIPSGDISTCGEILGPNLTAIVKASITILQIAGAIIAIVKFIFKPLLRFIGSLLEFDISCIF